MMDGPKIETHNTTTHSVELGLSARYFVYNKNGWSPYLFVGCNMATTFTKDIVYNDAYFGWGGPVAEQTNTYKYTNTSFPEELYFGAGINKTITSKWILNTQLLFNYSNEAQSMTDDNLSPLLQVGIAYSL